MRWIIAFCLLIALAVPVRGADGAPGEAVRLDELLRVVTQEYEGGDPVRPDELLQSALEAAGTIVPPLLVERPDGPGGGTLRLRIGERERSFALAGLSGLESLQPLLAQARDFIAAALPPAERPAALDARLAEGLLQALDPHSALLSAAAYGDFQSKASGRSGGLGMLLVSQEGRLTVDAVLPDSPAARAGVKAGDRILQIGEQAALALPADEALVLVRGRVGTRVALLVLRPGDPAPRQLTLRRSDLQLASVTGEVTREGAHERIGYLRVRSFQETTTAELGEHLQRMAVSRPGLRGIVLDLRDNPGGVLEQAIRMADLFLDRGTIVSLRGPRIKPEAIAARWYRSVSSAPLIVLVNARTASAAEIVAGALKNNHRALLVGVPTFGKSSVQSVFPLSGGYALKLTVARFYGLDGRSIEGRGVTPHLWLRPVTLQGVPARAHGLLATAVGDLAQRRAAAGADSAQPVRELPYLAPSPASGADDGAQEDDYALAVARRLLLLNSPQGQPGLMSQALDWARQERRRQDAALTRRLAETGLDWSAGPGSEGGQAELLRVELESRPHPAARWEPLPDGRAVAAGEQLRIIFTLRNAGAVPLHRVLGIVESAAPYLDGLELPIGLLPASETVQGMVETTLPADLPQGAEPLRLKIFDGQSRLHYRATVLLPVAAPPAARLALTLAVSDDGTGGSRGNGDGRAQPGELLALRIQLHNLGAGPSGAGRYWLSTAADAPLELVQSWRTFASLPPGGGTENTLLLAVGSVPAPGVLPLWLHVMNDSYAAQTQSWAFQLRMAQALPRMELRVPALDVALPAATTTGARVVLRGAARDEAGLRDVVVFRNDRKVYYAGAAGAERQQDLRIALALEPGRNLLRVVARNREGLTSSRSLLLWQGVGTGFPIAGRTRAGG